MPKATSDVRPILPGQKLRKTARKVGSPVPIVPRVKDKMAVLGVISGLINNPAFLTDGEHPLFVTDFPERFHQIVFNAIQHLVSRGVQKIDEIAIDDFLSHYPEQYQVWNNNNGIEYIRTAASLVDGKNFDYYYEVLKKCSLLNELSAYGFNISQFYNPDLIQPEDQQIVQENLSENTASDILDSFDEELAELRQKYCLDTDIVEGHISNGIRELKEELSKAPDMGLPMNSAKMTTIFHGRRLKKLYLRSAGSGLGKSRQAFADAALLAVPKFYDPDKKRWVKTGFQESVLFITTELEVAEIQTMLLAYIACVPEDHIIDNKYEPEEEARVNKAIEISEHTNFFSVYIPSFDADDIENIIKRYKFKFNVGYVFVDYLFSSSKLFTEMSAKARGFKLREDQTLMVFAEKLKTLANKYNIHIDTSTQVNSELSNMKNPDQSVIRGAKAIADKVDVGYVLYEPSEADKAAIQSLMPQAGLSFCTEPNIVASIYKVRRGKISHVKVFMYFNYATLRTKDLFVTDREYKLLDVTSKNVELILDDTELSREEVDKVDTAKVVRGFVF